jgi:hypothetical protein
MGTPPNAIDFGTGTAKKNTAPYPLPMEENVSKSDILTCYKEQIQTG